jgi:RinA family phage transcriptional activator
VTVAKKQKYFQQVERLLYDYKYLDQAIANLEAELEAIMPQTSTSVVKLGQGSTKTPFDTSQTERWGIRRAESRLRARLLEKRRHKKAIKAVREQLTDEENTFIWLRYDHEKAHEEIWEALHMSRAQYFRFRKDTIDKIAKHLGIV